MWALCGFGYWVQGFRCFPWLALNFHLAHGLGFSPSTLQLVQNTGNLPMVAKPLLGVLSDAVCIGGAHRLPYISIGAFLQLLSWGTLAVIPVTGERFPTLMACILVSNLGASFAEVVSDALVAEFSRTQKAGELQSYAFMALAAGALLGNLSGAFVILKSQEPKVMFFTFALLLAIHLSLSLSTKETSLCFLPYSNHHLVQNSLAENFIKQFCDLTTAINEERIFYPLLWIVASIAVVPVLSGSMFCFQTQCLKLDPSVIGLSKVIGQLMVLSATMFYNRFLKRIPMRRLIFGVQILYALSLLSDLFLVKQINLKLGISNEVYVLCLSALAEAIAQFKILPFTALFSSLCPYGCEGSLFAFFASSLCLSSILSGMFGVGLVSLIGVSSGDYSSLSSGIILQFIAALVPLGWISYVPVARRR
ncbi:probable folate-biopterin transporter 8, chloroplastic isoform X1 [Phoenix dactylifera]|uniref:Probable folate-biopterin transporter 8, chloroplastic isoform X1 n=1 Tax=Phoenix dactylifera TaxID=42345 RepID=A0A8B7BRJ1_PHODC|nr:probable folate-biopterin transporter 8, chloroplastic isoform X1 [Phoenix dactylifera]